MGETLKKLSASRRHEWQEGDRYWITKAYSQPYDCELQNQSDTRDDDEPEEKALVVDP